MIPEQPATRGRHRQPSPGRRRGGGAGRALRAPASAVRGGGRVVARIPVVAVLVLCLPVAAAVAVLGLHDRADASVSTSRQHAVAAARQAAGDLLSYDYRSIGKDVATAKSETTGRFAQQYAETASRLQSEAVQARAIVQASPSAPGVVSASDDEVVVLLFVDQATVRQPVGQKTPTTRIDQSRVRMTMSRVHGRWLVSQLDAL